MREIMITPVLNGYVVKVGCQIVVFDNLDKLASELVRYYTSPIETEREYMKLSKVGTATPVLRGEREQENNCMTDSPNAIPVERATGRGLASIRPQEGNTSNE